MSDLLGQAAGTSSSSQGDIWLLLGNGPNAKRRRLTGPSCCWLLQPSPAPLPPQPHLAIRLLGIPSSSGCDIYPPPTPAAPIAAISPTAAVSGAVTPCGGVVASGGFRLGWTATVDGGASSRSNGSGSVWCNASPACAPAVATCGGDALQPRQHPHPHQQTQQTQQRMWSKPSAMMAPTSAAAAAAATAAAAAAAAAATASTGAPTSVALGAAGSEAQMDTAAKSYLVRVLLRLWPLAQQQLQQQQHSEVVEGQLEQQQPFQPTTPPQEDRAPAAVCLDQQEERDAEERGAEDRNAEEDMVKEGRQEEWEGRWLGGGNTHQHQHQEQDQSTPVVAAVATEGSLLFPASAQGCSPLPPSHQQYDYQHQEQYNQQPQYGQPQYNQQYSRKQQYNQQLQGPHRPQWLPLRHSAAVPALPSLDSLLAEAAEAEAFAASTVAVDEWAAHPAQGRGGDGCGGGANGDDGSDSELGRLAAAPRPPPLARALPTCVNPSAFVEQDGTLLHGAVLQAACDVIRLSQLRGGIIVTTPWNRPDGAAAAVTAFCWYCRCSGAATATTAAALQRRRALRPVPLAVALRLLAAFGGAARALQAAEARAAAAAATTAAAAAVSPMVAGGLEAYRALCPLMARGFECVERLLDLVEGALSGSGSTPCASCGGLCGSGLAGF